MQMRTGIHTGVQGHAQIVYEGEAQLPVKCPSCDEETYALPGTLCEHCNPTNTALLPQREPMEARCGTCGQVVTSAVLRQSGDLEQMSYLCCPACGVLWCAVSPYRFGRAPTVSGALRWERITPPEST